METVIDDLRGQLGHAPSFVGDDERDEVIEGILEARWNELVLSTARVPEAMVEKPPGAEAEREGDNITRVCDCD